MALLLLLLLAALALVQGYHPGPVRRAAPRRAIRSRLHAAQGGPGRALVQSLGGVLAGC